MDNRFILRVGGSLAAATLTLPLAACSTQSVDLACLQTNLVFSSMNRTLDSGVSNAAQRIIDGEDVSHEEIFAPVHESFDQAQNDVSNREVGEALDNFEEAFNAFESTHGAAYVATAVDALQFVPVSTEYAEASEEFRINGLEVKATVDEYLAGVNAAGEQLRGICTD